MIQHITPVLGVISLAMSPEFSIKDLQDKLLEQRSLLLPPLRLVSRPRRKSKREKELIMSSHNNCDLRWHHVHLFPSLQSCHRSACQDAGNHCQRQQPDIFEPQLQYSSPNDEHRVDHDTTIAAYIQRAAETRHPTPTISRKKTHTSRS